MEIKITDAEKEQAVREWIDTAPRWIDTPETKGLITSVCLENIYSHRYTTQDFCNYLLDSGWKPCIKWHRPKTIIFHEAGNMDIFVSFPSDTQVDSSVELEAAFDFYAKYEGISRGELLKKIDEKLTKLFRS